MQLYALNFTPIVTAVPFNYKAKISSLSESSMKLVRKITPTELDKALPNARKDKANSLIQSNSKRNGRIGCTDGTFEGAIQQTFLLQEMPHT